MKVERQETRIMVPHLSGELIVFHPFLQGTYVDSARKLGKQMNIMAQTASLAYDAYKNSKDDIQISNEIKQIMKNNWFYTANGNLWSKNHNGVYVQDHPEFEEDATNSDGLIMDEKDLQSRLSSREEHGIVYSEDGSVRFVPHGFKIGMQTPEDLAKNAYIRALAGEEGAEKLAYIASQHKEKPYLNALENVQESIKRVAWLYSGWYVDRLDVIGNSHGVSPSGFSFRVVEKNFHEK